jgi:hypothetical protein
MHIVTCSRWQQSVDNLFRLGQFTKSQAENVQVFFETWLSTTIKNRTGTTVGRNNKFTTYMGWLHVGIVKLLDKLSGTNNTKCYRCFMKENAWSASNRQSALK